MFELLNKCTRPIKNLEIQVREKFKKSFSFSTKFLHNSSSLQKNLLKVFDTEKKIIKL